MAVIDRNYDAIEVVLPTYDALAKMYSGEMISNGEEPILRVADIKVFTSGDNNMRYRLIVSDGNQTGQVIIATQMHGLIDSGELKKGSLVRFCRYVAHSIQNRMVIVGIDLKVVVENRDPVQPTVRLTSNAIEMICNNGFQGDEPMPVLQVTDLKNLGAGQENTSQRYRGLLSDGVHCQQAMFATQLNYLIDSGKLQKGSIIRLTYFVTHIIQNRLIIVVIGLELIDEMREIVGEPKLFVPHELPSTMINGIKELEVAN